MLHIAESRLEHERTIITIMPSRVKHNVYKRTAHSPPLLTIQGHTLPVALPTNQIQSLYNPVVYKLKKFECNRFLHCKIQGTGCISY